jgi:hypothetical protein
VGELGGHVGADGGLEGDDVVQNTQGVFAHFFAGEKLAGFLGEVQAKLYGAGGNGDADVVVGEEKAAVAAGIEGAQGGDGAKEFKVGVGIGRPLQRWQLKACLQAADVDKGPGSVPSTCRLVSAWQFPSPTLEEHAHGLIRIQDFGGGFPLLVEVLVGFFEGEGAAGFAGHHLDEVVFGQGAVLKHGGNPVVGDEFRYGAENVGDGADAASEDVKQALLDAFVVAEVAERDALGDGAALDAAFALFKGGRVPREVEVDEAAESLEVQPGAGRVRTDENLERADANLLLQDVPINGLDLAVLKELR